MCTNTALSHFLEGVNFLDDVVENKDVEMEFQLEEADDFLCEYPTLLSCSDISMDSMEEEVLDLCSLESASETLPPLKKFSTSNRASDDQDMDLLVSPPDEVEDEGLPSIEKLANSMRRSEQTKLQFQKLAALQEDQLQQWGGSESLLVKANPFFTGSRVTITPELEKSREQLWSFVRLQQQQVTHNALNTAAA